MLVSTYASFINYLKLDDFGYFNMGFSVANMNFLLAIHLKHKNIVLIGQDLAYAKDGLSHTKDYSNLDKHEGHFQRDKNKYTTQAYGDNGKVESSFVWTLFRHNFEQDVANAKKNYYITTYNCTEGGARIEGTIEKPFLWACENLLHKDLNKPFEKLEPLSLNKQNEFLLKAYYKVYQSIKHCRDFSNKFIKSYDKIKNSFMSLQNSQENETLIKEIIKDIDKIKTQIDELYNTDYIADESNNNEVNFENIKSSKNLSLMINAKNVSNNKINYNLIQSLTEASSLGKGSKIILKATQNANNNLIKLKDCSSAAVESSCIIKADKESAFNKIINNNTAFSTASDKRQGYVGLIAGVSANSHDNIMELVNLNIDEYKNQDAIFLAPSGTSDISNFKSYNNTLYLGGELNFFKDVNIDLLSGSVFHEVNKKGKIITQILPHQEDFSKNNRLIIDTQDVKSEVVNNFENFTFILPNKIKNPILTIEKLINLPANGSMEILTKNKPTKGKYILIQSDVGIYDGDNGLLNQQELENLLEKMKNNKNKFNYNKIEKLAKSTLKNVNFSFEVSDDAKIIYINIL